MSAAFRWPFYTAAIAALLGALAGALLPRRPPPAPGRRPDAAARRASARGAGRGPPLARFPAPAATGRPAPAYLLFLTVSTPIEPKTPSGRLAITAVMRNCLVYWVASHLEPAEPCPATATIGATE